jgi:hypothetical protein
LYPVSELKSKVYVLALLGNDPKSMSPTVAAAKQKFVRNPIMFCLRQLFVLGTKNPNADILFVELNLAIRFAA